MWQCQTSSARAILVLRPRCENKLDVSVLAARDARSNDMIWQDSGSQGPISAAATVPLAMASFDVFDTLLGRPYLEPDELHEAVWCMLGLHKVGAIQTAQKWRQARVAAEQDARRLSAGKEVILRSIYERLALALGCDAADLEPAARLELAQEQRVLRRLALGEHLLQNRRREGLSVAFLSDMYLPDCVIRSTLIAQSLLGPEDLLLVSSTSGLTKHNGGLFRQLLQQTGLPAAAIQHVGDNCHSDVAVPREIGIQAHLQPAPALSAREVQLASDSDADRFIRRTLAGSARLARLREHGLEGKEAEIASVSAAVAAPLLIGFVLWTLQQAQDAGIRNLYFLARDGQILHGLAERLAAVVTPEIRPRYLYVSRQALYLPALALAAPNASEVMSRICNGRAHRDVEASLRLPAGAVAGLLGLHPDESKLSRLHLSDLECEAFTTALRKSPHGAGLDQAAELERRALRAYLKQEEFLDSKRSAVVDIGWRGNLQALLAAALGATGEPANLLGIYLGLHQSPPKSAGESRSYVSHASRFNEALLELMCAADHGSTVRYELESGRAVPRLACATNDAALAWGVGLQQRIIQRTCESFVDAVPAKLLCAPVGLQTLRHLGVAAFSNFQRNPTASEAEAYGAFSHSSDAGHSEYSEIAPVMSMSQALLAFVPGKQDAGTFWAQGSLRRSAAQLRLQPLADAFLKTRTGVVKLWRRTA
jgi:FMN phosphatase YigB (HAD superfamily)